MSALLTENLTDGQVPYDPGAPEPDFLFEVIDGIIVRKTVGASEIRLANWHQLRIAPALTASGFGDSFIELGYDLPNASPKRKPDLSILSYERWPRTRPFPRGDFLPVAPDLAVEIISPHERSRSTTAELRDYFQGGVRVVWVVYPNVEQVHFFSSPTSVRILTRADELTADPLFPGLRITLAELFPLTETGPAGTSQA